MARDIDIKFPRERRISLASRTLTERRAMDNELWLLLGKEAGDRRKICEIKLGACQTSNLSFWREPRRGLDEAVTDQSSGAGDPDELHIDGSPAARASDQSSDSDDQVRAREKQ